MNDTRTQLDLVSYSDYARRDGRDHHVAGDVRLLRNVNIPALETARDVLLYLPPSYHASTRRYPVLYMQDGQNLFDPLTSFGGQDWRVAETMERLVGEGYKAIVVGIYHGGERRLREYNPFAGRIPAEGGAYVAFLAEQLKPFVDSQLRTQPEAAATGVIGSSMGGLISLYAFFSRPEVFGMCGAMSPSLFVAHRAILDYVRGAPFNPGRIYLDHGSREPSARPMLQVLIDKGYRIKRDLRYVSEFGGKHDEAAWARRFPGVVRFLLKEWKVKKTGQSEGE